MNNTDFGVFGYNKDYDTAKNYIDRTFIHPDKMTLNQMKEVAEHFKLTVDKIKECINWSLTRKREIKH